MDVIKTYLDNVFAAFPQTEKLRALKGEMLAGMEEKYHALKNEGKSENEAIGGVIANFGRVSFGGIDEHIQTLYIISKERFMAVSTVNISFQTELLGQIDRVAQSEARTRSELIREAARIYIERKNRWASIFAYGESLAAKYQISEEDVNEEIRKHREEKK